MKKALLLGGSGFIGQKLAGALLPRSPVVIADRAFPQGMENRQNLRFMPLDFTRETDFSPFLEDVDVVYHLVSTVLPSEGTSGLEQEIRDNVFPTLRLLDALVKRPCRLVFISSGGTVYGECGAAPAKEDAPLSPLCKYAAHKVAIEQHLRLYRRYHGLDYRVVRLSNPYSAQVFAGRSQGAVPIFIDRIMRGEPLLVRGDGSAVRDYIHIDDAVAGILAVAGHEGEAETFNVATGTSVSLNRLIGMIAEEIPGALPRVEYRTASLADVAESRLDISRIRSLTAWAPKIPLAEGIRMCIAEWMKNTQK